MKKPVSHASERAYDELVQEFYGINPVTRKADNVGVTRSGKISHWTERGYKIHQMVGQDAPQEITRIFGLIHLIELHPRIPNDERMEILMDLQAKALSFVEYRSLETELSA